MTQERTQRSVEERPCPTRFNEKVFYERLGQIYEEFNLRVQRADNFIQATIDTPIDSTDTVKLRIDGQEVKTKQNESPCKMQPFVDAIEEAFFASITDEQDTLEDKRKCNIIRKLLPNLANKLPGDFILNILDMIATEINLQRMDEEGIPSIQVEQDQ